GPNRGTASSRLSNVTVRVSFMGRSPVGIDDRVRSAPPGSTEPPIDDRGGEDDGVHHVENAAKPGDDLRSVFTLAVPLDERFGQVAEQSGETDRQAECDRAHLAAGDDRPEAI